MNKRLLFSLLVCLAPALADGSEELRKAAENPNVVLPSTRRLDALKKADEFLAILPSGSEQLVAELGDPFYPGSKASPDKKSEVKNPLADQSPAQLLTRAAQSIQPTGTMLIGSEPYLLLGGKRYKSGDVISVTIDGLGVQVTISSIQRNSYTLRLEDQELRREFK